MAEGLGKDYYILVNSKQSKDVPSDVRGLQRIEYTSAKGIDANSLFGHRGLRTLGHPFGKYNRQFLNFAGSPK